MTLIIRFCLFGVLGIIGALIAGSVHRSISSRRIDLTGETTLALFPVWGLIALLYPPIAIHISSLPWYGRELILMAAFFVAQFLIGLGLRRLNICPWNYSGPGSIAGLIRISDAPAWFLAGAAIDWIYPWVKASAVALAA